MRRRTGRDRPTTGPWRPATQAVRGGTARSEWGETSEAIFLTSGYAYDCAADAAARFAGEQIGMTYLMAAPMSGRSFRLLTDKVVPRIAG